jgi:hypothetical protein
MVRWEEMGGWSIGVNFIVIFEVGVLCLGCMESVDLE